MTTTSGRIVTWHWSSRHADRLSIPVIASLNGTTAGGWVHYARHLENAGANAIELNIYDVVVDPLRSAADVERRYLDLVEAVRAEVNVPFAVKLGPWFTSLGHFAVALQSAGVDGLVLFNRLLPTRHRSRHARCHAAAAAVDIARVAVAAALDRHSPRFRVVLARGDDGSAQRLRRDEAVARRCRRHDDSTSALLIHGPQRIATMLSWMRDWMIERDYESVDQLRGSVSHRNVPDPEVLRAGELLPGAAQLAPLTVTCSLEWGSTRPSWQHLHPERSASPVPPPRAGTCG